MIGLAELQAQSGWLWPYLVMVLIGFLPNEIWRSAAAAAGSRLSADSEIFIWVKYVAAALLAGVVAKLLLSPAGALALVSGTGRAAAMAAGLGAFFLFRRSIAAAVLSGEAVFIAFGFWGK